MYCSGVSVVALDGNGWWTWLLLGFGEMNNRARRSVARGASSAAGSTSSALVGSVCGW